MSNCEAYLKILQYIDTPEIDTIESPLLQVEKISFEPNEIKHDNYFSKYDSLLSTDENLSFDNINFLEISQNDLISLKNLYISKSDPTQKRFIMIFILLIVLKQNYFYDIFDSEAQRYDLLFNSSFLPPNPNEKCSKALIHLINNFLYNEYCNNSTEILQKINIYINQINNDNCIYNFLPFFIQLLKSEKQELIETFINSDLFNKIIELSQEKLPIFDFYRQIIFKYPEFAFRKVFVIQNMHQNFFDENRNQSIILILEKAIEKLTDDLETLKQILLVFSFIISQALQKGEEKSKLVFGMLFCIDNCFNVFTPEIDLSLFFEAIANFAVYSENENSFELSINLVSKLITKRPSFLFQLKKHKNFFNILSKCKKAVNYLYLMNLVKLDFTEMIHFYQVIPILLSLINDLPQDEEKIVDELLKLSSNKGNLIELDRAKVPEFILKRLPIIQENEVMCRKYLNLFSIITAKIFRKTTFLHTIELLKNEEFKYSCSILSILNDHLENNITEDNNYLAFKYRKDQLLCHNEPFSFYRFDNFSGCGIICPKINLSTPFTFSFWLRMNEINDNGENPLVYFESDKCKLDFYFKNNKIYFENLTDTFELNECSEIEKGKWYFYCFSIERELFNCALTLNLSDDENSNYVSKKIKFPFNSGEFNLNICQKPIVSKAVYDYPSLVCDMSLFLLVNENLDYISMRKKMIDFLSSNDLNINYFPHLLCLINPSQSQDNVCFNVNKNAANASYEGTIIPIIPNFYDVMQNIESIQTFLPLISNLSNDKDNENGKEKLHLILSIFCKTICICEESFLKSRFFELLVSFLYDCEQLIYKETFKDLLEMFLKIKNHELKKSFLKSVYLNYNFLSNLFGSVETLFYSYSPLQLYQTKENDSLIVFEDLSLIIYTGVKHFFEPNENSKYYWNYIKRLCIDSPNDKNINCLIDFLNEDKTLKTEYVALKILDILSSIFEAKTIIDSSLNNFTPYIITYSQYHESIDILKLILMIIKTVSMKTNMKENIYPSIYHLMIVFRPSLYIKQDEIEMLINLVFKMIVEEQMISFTSLLTIFLSYSKSEVFDSNICNSFVLSEYIQNNISSIPFWNYWLIKLFLHIQNKDVAEFAKLCITCVKNQASMIDLCDFFDICKYIFQKPGNEFNAKEFFISVKSSILIHLINTKKIDYSYVYNFLLFSTDCVKKENNFPLSYFGDFVQDLFSNFDLNVTLRKTVNKNLLDFLVSKTTSMLSKLVHTKVQLCGGKIEIPLKDVNAYLLNLEDNNLNDETVEEVDDEEKYTKISTSILNKCLDQYKGMIEEKHKHDTRWGEDLKNTLKFERQYTESEDAPLEYKLLFVFDLKKFNFYYNEKHENISELETKYKIENNYLNKMKKSFMESISLFPGPWENPNKNKEVKRFKILNRVSKSGKKILMRINKKFNDHSDASLNRIAIDHVNTIDKLVYKTIKTAPEPLRKSFKTKVAILSQSKDEEGFLKASESCITLRTETSNNFIYWDEIEFILNRKEGQFENTCEIFKNNGRSYYIKFIECEKKYFYSFIDKLKLNYENKKCGDKFDFFNSLRISCNGIYQNKKITTIVQDIDLMNVWKTRKITTFSYIYYLNLLCGRSFNNIRQYIIYPFVLDDCESTEISLDNSESYRKFDFPISALSNHMLQEGIEKYEEFYDIHPYLFSEVPSSSLIISWYLIRTEPFTTIHVTKDQQYHNYPRFDNPDRIFNSIKEVINRMHEEGTAKEMIPEFFYFPFFLINENHFDLGMKSITKEQINDIILPNWSNCYYSFISTLRLMLEGRVADESIGKWIDMMFGIKRRVFNYNGKEYNIFKEYFYPEKFDPLFEEEVIQFGSLPHQIFNIANPARDAPRNHFAFEATIPDKSFSKRKDTRFVKNLLVCSDCTKAFEINNTNKENPPNLVQIDLKRICGNVLCYSRSLKLLIYGTKSDPFLTFYDLNSSETTIECKVPFITTAVCLAAGRYLVTGGKDCSIRVWDIARSRNQKVTQISSSSYHADHITSIGCCFDNFLLVSADRRQNLIFETLIDHVFINSVSLKEVKRKLETLTTTTTTEDADASDVEFENLFSFSTSKKDFFDEVKKIKDMNAWDVGVDVDGDAAGEESSLLICVFKSGVVAVSNGSCIFIFDSRGKLMCLRALDSEAVEMRKCYCESTREFLIVGAKSNKIYVFDVACLSLIVAYEAYFSSISTFQKSSSFVTYYKGKIQTFDFSKFVSQKISKKPPPFVQESAYK